MVTPVCCCQSFRDFTEIVIGGLTMRRFDQNAHFVLLNLKTARGRHEIAKARKTLRLSCDISLGCQADVPAYSLVKSPV